VKSPSEDAGSSHEIRLIFALCLAQAIKRVASEATGVTHPLIHISVAAASEWWWVSLNLANSSLSPEPPAGTLTGAIECRGTVVSRDGRGDMAGLLFTE
jgi:hypothetical protein